MEIWKNIVIENNIKTNYQVSNKGRVRNLDKITWKSKGVLKNKINNKSGYCQVGLHIDKKIYYKYVHRLVAEAFLNITEGKDEVNHINGVKTDNTVENLEWVNKKENMRHAFDNILVKNTQKQVNLYSLEGEFICEYPSISEAMRSIKGEEVNKASLKINSEILFKPNAQMYGYQWRLKDSNIPINNIMNDFHGAKGVVQLDLDGNYICEYDTISSAYKSLKVTDNGIISQVCKGRRKTYKGYIWEYSYNYYK